MSFKKRFQTFKEKYGRKALYGFLVYFVTKWAVMIFFGAKIVDFFKDKMP